MSIKTSLVEGDAVAPDDADLLAQIVHLPMGDEPRGEGWRIMTGNNRYNKWARVAYRYQITAC